MFRVIPYGHGKAKAITVSLALSTLVFVVLAWKTAPNEDERVQRCFE